MKCRGKVVTLSTVAVGLVVLAAAGIAAKDWIREEWWIRKLQTGEAKQQARAAKCLGGLHSVRAMALLFAAYGEISRRTTSRWIMVDETWSFSVIGESSAEPTAGGNSRVDYGGGDFALWTTCIDSLMKITREAPRGVEPALIKALRNDSPAVRAYSCDLLRLVRDTSEKAVLALKESLQDSDFKVRHAAAKALNRIQGTEDETQK